MLRIRVLQGMLPVLLALALFFAPVGVRAGGVCGGTYVVDPGDTLDSIAAMCGMSVNAIYASNPGISATLYTGQVLNLAASISYGPGTTPNTYNPYSNYYNYYIYPQVSPAGTYYVQNGDTFGGIATRFGIPVYDLWLANQNISNINVLYVGQLIYLPSSYGNGIVPVATSTEPAVLIYNEAPSGAPQGNVKFVIKTTEDMFISLQGKTNDGYTVISEYSISGPMNVKIIAGYYEYTAMVGGQTFYGQFNLPRNGGRTITFFKDKVTDSE